MTLWEQMFEKCSKKNERLLKFFEEILQCADNIPHRNQLIAQQALGRVTSNTSLESEDESGWDSNLPQRSKYFNARVRPYEFFMSAWTDLPTKKREKYGRLIAASINENPIATQVRFEHRIMAETQPYIAPARATESALAENVLLYWAFIPHNHYRDEAEVVLYNLIIDGTRYGHV